MNKFVFVASMCFLVVSSVAYEVIEDDDGQPFFLVPLQRQRRQTNVGISGAPGGGTRITAGHQGVLHNDGTHSVTGGGFVSKQFNPKGPTTLGGNLGYNHIPSGSNLNVGAANTRGFGTDLSATGTANIWRNGNGNTRLDAVGNYNRHFGGPGGTGRPDYYGGLQFNHRF